MKRTISILLLLFWCQVGMGQKKLNIVATSAWTGAYLELAGIDDYTIIAPPNMQHPTEYELQLKDIDILRKADLIVCGGYESMVEKIRNGLNIDDSKILQIKTDYNFENIKSAVFEISKTTETQNYAGNSIEYLFMAFEESRDKIKEAGLNEIPVLSQFFLQPIAHELGLNVQGVFGPRHLEPFEIGKLMELDFDLILDNAHNPASKPLLESKKGTKVVYLLNFPGTEGTETLEDVLRFNTYEIIKKLKN